jgi:hypothetical protein
MSLQSPEQRYELLLEGALASEELWSLESSGKLIRFRLPDGTLALPLWPSQETAALEARDASEQPCRLELSEFLDAILPDLAGSKQVVAAFPLKGSSYIIEAQLFLDRILKEWDEDD